MIEKFYTIGLSLLLFLHSFEAKTQTLSMTAMVTNCTCTNYDDGEINITVTGGTTPYSYLWSNHELTEDLIDLPAGSYTVTVTDAGNSKISDSWMVTEPGAISWFGSLTNVSCYGKCDGTITTVFTLGGTSPYTYNWEGPGPFVSTDMDLTSLCAGSYNLTVTDAHYCDARIFRSITEPDILAVTGVVTNVSCAGNKDGEIVINVTGGTETYSFLWSLPAQTQNISGLDPGTYTVTITDANACTLTGSWIVGQDKSVCSTLNLQNEIVLDTRCYGASQTIYVAGPPPVDPTTFLVADGGHVTMVAGQNIIYYVGTRVFSGGYMNGYIDIDGPWCDTKAATIVTVPGREDEISPVTDKSFFTIYPNPTTGGFSLELKDMEEASEVKVEMYGIYGERLLNEELEGMRKYDFSLAGKPNGIYFIRVVTGKFAGTGKIIKQ